MFCFLCLFVGVSITMSLSEGLHKWMLFPAVQRLMDIAIHCSAKL